MASGDDSAVGDLLREHGPRVMGMLRKSCPFVRDSHVFESALHDGALAVWKAAKRLPTPLSLGAYYCKVCYRKVLRLSNREPALNVIPSAWLESVPAPAEGRDGTRSEQASSQQVMMNTRVAKALADLSPLQQAVLAADRVSNFRAKTAEIAAALGTSQGTVANARNRIRAKLQHLMRPGRDALALPKEANDG
ncbi:MAG: RNA polymerase sigma factor [Planctomycetota bacterium]